MTDLYLVTTEHTDDGMWFDDPEGFDSEREAREFANKRPPPGGCFFGIYRCELIEAIMDAVGTGKEP